MTRHDIQSITCATLWTGAAAIAIVGTIRDDLITLFWAVEVTTIALLPTFLIMMEDVARRERLLVEEVGEMIAARAIRQCAEDGVTRLH